MNELELKYHKYSNGYQRGPIYFMDKFEKSRIYLLIWQ